MALRPPLVLGADGLAQQVQATDTLSPAWSGTAVLVVQVVAQGGFVRLATAVTSTTGSGTLKAGTPVVLGITGLPANLFLVGGSASADGTVSFLLTSIASVSIAVAVTLTLTAVQPR